MALSDSKLSTQDYKWGNTKHITSDKLIQHFRFSWGWRFKSRSSGSWHHVVLW